jgi:hypothetical protein
MKSKKPRIGYNPRTGQIGPIIPTDDTDDNGVVIGYDPSTNTIGPMLVDDSEDDDN